MAIGAAIAEAVVRVRADTSGFRGEVATGVKSQLAGVEGGFLGASKSMLRFTAATVGVSTATVAAGIALREIVVGGAQLEQELDVLRVVLNATDAEMKEISETARQLGADVTLPGISAGDAAVAMNELGKAGLNITDVLSGARGVLQLAAAAEIEVADAAQIVGAALNTFGLEGTQATHVADLLAGASIAAAGEIGDMALAMQQAGTVARQAGLTIEQTAGIIALLAKNGILGSDAGTSIRTGLLKLIPTTKEAKQFTEALGIQFDETRQLGEQLPAIIEQYRVALSHLDPALQQVALTQIFGTDAVRFASIIFREGAAGLSVMTAEANRNGAAQELAAAKTEGLIGKFEGLKSQLSTVATDISHLTNPVIGLFIDALSEGVSAIDFMIGGVRRLKGAVESLSDVELPDWLDPTDTSIGDAAEKVANAGKEAVTQGLLGPVLGAARRVQGVVDGIRGTADEVQKEIRDSISVGNVEQEARDRGFTTGRALGEGTARGIESAEVLAVNAARRMVSQVAAAGRQAVAAAIAGAQQNLTSIGTSLVQDAGRLIDATVTEGVSAGTAAASSAVSAGQRKRQQDAIRKAEAELALAIKDVPIMREIERLQEQLDRDEARDSGQDVRRGLRDAQEALADARSQIQTVGGLDARQQAQQGRFLRPFIEGVQDAKGEVKRFNTEAKLDRLQKRLDDQTDDITENIERLRDSVASAREALIQSQQSFSTGGVAASLKSAGEEQKRAIQQGIDDAIDAFNRGQITIKELNRRVAKVLEDNGVDYKNAGGVLGTAFVNGFNDKLKALGSQGGILQDETRTGQGSQPDIIVPDSVRRTARLNNEDAQRALAQAMVAAEEAGYLELVRIRKAIEKGNTPAAPRPAVTGESAADKANPTSTTTTVGTRPKPGTRYKDPPEK